MTALPDPTDLDAIEDPIERSRAYVAAMGVAQKIYADGRRRALGEAVQIHGSKLAVAQRLGVSPAAVGKALNTHTESA
jgi:hypothetical protein